MTLLYINEETANNISEELDDSTEDEKISIEFDNDDNNDIILTENCNISWNLDKTLIIKARNNIIFQRGSQINITGNGKLILIANSQYYDNIHKDYKCNSDLCKENVEYSSKDKTILNCNEHAYGDNILKIEYNKTGRIIFCDDYNNIISTEHKDSVIIYETINKDNNNILDTDFIRLQYLFDIEDLKKISFENDNLGERYIMVRNIKCNSEMIEPLGDLNNPFTGYYKLTISTKLVTTSFDECIIDNEEYDDLEKEKCMIVSGLFYYTKNATIQNIVIENNNNYLKLFNNRMEKYYSLYFGIVAGISYNTVFKSIEYS